MTAMNDFAQTYRVLKIAAGGAVALLLGVVLIVAGDIQSIIAGSGAIVAAALVFGFLGWSSASAKRLAARPDGVESPEAENPARLVWLGIGMTLAPGLLYFYLRFAMSRFDPLLLLFVSVPLLIAGLGCTGIGLRSLAKTGGKAEGEAGVGTTEGLNGEPGAAAKRPRD